MKEFSQKEDIYHQYIFKSFIIGKLKYIINK